MICPPLVLFRKSDASLPGAGTVTRAINACPPEAMVGGRYRLKNRTELVSLLETDPAIGDTDLIWSAWKRWGCELANRLRGTFAVVIYDPEAGAIYAARDAFGHEPLFLAHDSSRWLFSDDPSSVRSAMAHGPSIDGRRIAEFLVDRVVDCERTFFANISRLPGGHWTKITAGGRQTVRYWSVSDAPSSRADDMPERRFRELFDRSVAFNALDQDNLGIFVSGGMDSSSILASFLTNPENKKQRVIGLTRSYRENSNWTDGPYINALKEKFAFEQHEVISSFVNPLDGAETIIAANDGPVQAYGFAASIPLYNFASQHGVNVILDGHGGDEVVSLGMGLLNELARRGEWRKLWEATKAPATKYGGSRFDWFSRYLIHSPAYATLRGLVSHGRPTTRIPDSSISILSPELEAALDQTSHVTRNPFSRRDHTERDLHEFALGQPIQQYAQEVLVLSGRAYGIEFRMPFFDRDLAELSLSLRAETKLKNGLTRAILRDAMADALPAELLTRPDKFDFADSFIAGLMADRRRLLDLTDPGASDIGPFVNTNRLNEMRKQVSSEHDTIDSSTARALFRVAQLSMWLTSLQNSRAGAVD